MAKKQKFPDEIYVTYEEDGDTSYLLATTQMEDAGENTEQVAVYRLSDLKRKVIKHVLVSD